TGQLVVAQVRWRSPAEVEGVQRSAPALPQLQQLLLQASDVPSGQALVPQHLVEVAVGAHARAERHVDVERGGWFVGHASRGYPSGWGLFSRGRAGGRPRAARPGLAESLGSRASAALLGPRANTNWAHKA